MSKFDKRALFIDDISKTIIHDSDFLDHTNLHLEGAFWLPCLGRTNFDGHVFISGATGSGKSYIIRRMINNDYLKRSVILFTDLTSNDPEFLGMNYVKFDEGGLYNSAWVQDNIDNKIVIFDDVQFNKSIIQFRDVLLEKGRHRNCTVICVNHKIQDYFHTKVPLTESRYVITFPFANKGAVFRYLKHEMELERKKLDAILNEAIKEGRHLIIHRFSPNIIATTESLFKL